MAEGERGYAGVRLIDVLDDAGFSSAPRSEVKRCIIVAGSLDGYQAIFSWNELRLLFIAMTHPLCL